MAYKQFAAGEEALAADVNAYLMSQAVARFASAAQRTSQLASPVLNQLSVVDARPGVVQFWNGSAWADLAPLMQWNAYVGTTNANGDVVVTFPRAFGATPAIALTGGVYNYPQLYSILGASTTSFTVRLFTTSAVASNASITFHWIAVGAYP